LPPKLSFHDDACAHCGAEHELIRISEFGKALCADCFPGFLIRRVESLMRRRQMYKKGDTIGVALSGGKDSAALMHLLHSLRGRMRIQVVGLHVTMGLGEFSDISQDTAALLCEQVGVPLHLSNVADFGVCIEPLGQFRQCNVCGAVRRALLNRITQKLEIQTLATGHTLDDILQFMLKGLLSGQMEAPRPLLPPSTHRPRKIKPLYFTPESATAKYAELLDLPHTDVECPHFDPASRRFNEIFELLESKAPMGKMQFAHTMLKAMKAPGVDELQRSCKMCGEPTNTTYCPICRLRIKQAGEHPNQEDE
jgi:tRNA-5-methyluridine54 2-sulfurtransferase